MGYLRCLHSRQRAGSIHAVAPHYLPHFEFRRDVDHFIAIAFCKANAAESAKIFPWWREHLDLVRVLNYLDAVLDVRRDGVGVAGTQLMS